MLVYQPACHVAKMSFRKFILFGDIKKPLETLEPMGYMCWRVWVREFVVGLNTRETQKSPRASVCKRPLFSSLVAEAGGRAGSLPLAPLLCYQLCPKHLLNQPVDCMASGIAQGDQGPDSPAVPVQTLPWP